MNPMTKAWAVAPAGWALGRTPSRVLATVLGISAARVRHKRTEGDNCVADSCALVLHPAIDGASIVIAHLEALERRYLEEAKASPAKLRERLNHLIRQQEHLIEAHQNRALLTGEGAVEACLDHARVLIEIACLLRVLGDDS